jgi:predicted NBD/HSP70 family sugar kinase
MLKEVNSSMIERLVYEYGPLSKPELAKLTSLSLPTINKLVDDLEKIARLSPAGLSGKGVGRKAMRYETNRHSGCLLACYYQRGSYLCRLADMLNYTIYETSFPLDTSSFQGAVNSTVRAVNALIKKAPSQVKIIGLGLPGVVKPDGSLLGIPQLEVWEGFNPRKLLQERYEAAVFVENNVKLSAAGYFFVHLRERCENLVYLYVGNGIGSGIILNGRVHQGAEHFSGEIGFMTAIQEAPSRDSIASGGYLEARVSGLVDYSTGDFRDPGNPARREEFASILGMIAVNHVAVLNPELIVLAGRVFDDALIETIGRNMAACLPRGIMPRLVRDQSGSTGLEGLIISCRGYITTGTSLVQNTGIHGQINRMAG